MGTRRTKVRTAGVLAVVGGTVAAIGAGVVAPATAGDAEAGAKPSTWDVRLLGERLIPKGLEVEGMPVGELSGLDYDRRTGDWYVISDDTDLAPARFYTAELDLDDGGLHGVRLTAATSILRTDGSEFPPHSADDTEVADPESIRVDPLTGLLWWSSEGKREVPDDGSPAALVDPWVRVMTPNGRHLAQTGQPATSRMSATEQGPRENGIFEGLTLTTDGRRLVTSMEAPLYQDGDEATAEHGSVNRLTWYDKLGGEPVRQLAYEVEPVPVEGVGDNGISEILAVDAYRYLVVERSYVDGYGNTIRAYEIDVRGATDVLRDGSLADGGYRPVRKRLVLDLGTLGLDRVDNIEAVSWGPRLSTGERTLVFASDDNFGDSQVNQVVAVALDRD